MAKRYHHSVSKHVHHSDGPHVYKHSSAHDGHEYYAGMHDKRRTEVEDGHMISEDKSEVANLPQNVIMKPWVDHEAYLPEGLDDTIRGIDHQIEMDDSKRKAHFVPKKV